MGCCSSNFTIPMAEALDEVYMPAKQTQQQRMSSKRSYSSRISSGSSGVFSRCSTPSRRSILSRCSSTPSRTPKPKPNSVNYQECHKRDTPTPMFSICDDFDEAQCGKLPQQQQELDRSCGYFSGSLTSGSPVSTPSKSRMHTADTSSSCSSVETASGPVSDLEMEMYMMTHAETFMPKTSSPLFERRDVTFDASSGISASYDKWRHHLQHTPACMLNNVTRIPEAIAGLFCPATFPAFSDLEDMENAAKRYKVDEQQLLYVEPQRVPALGVTHTIAITTTEL